MATTRELLLTIPGFTIQGADDLGNTGYQMQSQGHFDGAPSRPPSRTSNKTPMNGVIDLTEEHARGILLLPVHFSSCPDLNDSEPSEFKST